MTFATNSIFLGARRVAPYARRVLLRITHLASARRVQSLSGGVEAGGFSLPEDFTAGRSTRPLASSLHGSERAGWESLASPGGLTPRLAVALDLAPMVHPSVRDLSFHDRASAAGPLRCKCALSGLRTGLRSRPCGGRSRSFTPSGSCPAAMVAMSRPAGPSLIFAGGFAS
jgi:hypothetical protein